MAELMDFKSAVLEREGLDVDRRVPVVADLTGDWTPPLLAAGFEPARRTAWVVEGLLMYLGAAACAQLFTTIRSHSAVGSRIATEYFARPPGDMVAEDPDELAAEALLIDVFASGLASPPGRWLVE